MLLVQALLYMDLQWVENVRRHQHYSGSYHQAPDLVVLTNIFNKNMRNALNYFLQSANLLIARNLKHALSHIASIDPNPNLSLNLSTRGRRRSTQVHHNRLLAPLECPNVSHTLVPPETDLFN